MKTITKQKVEKRERRHKRIRAQVRGTHERPRLAVFRSNRYVSAQIIDDDSERSLMSMSTKMLKTEGPLKEQAYTLGKKLATAAKAKGVKRVIFDRGGFIYMGNVKAFAEGARKGGLLF